MKNETRDGWSKFDISARVVASILIPAAILYFTLQEKSNEANRLQQQYNQDLAQRNADRAASLLKLLASQNRKERLLAIHIIGYFNNHDQLPPELGPALLAVFATDGDQEVRKAISNVLPRVALKESSAVKITQPPEKAAKVPRDTRTAYSRLSNRQLKDSTLRLVVEMRSFLGNERSGFDSILYSYKGPPSNWNEYTSALSRVSTHTNLEYDRRFKVESILLRDELLSRLPKQPRDQYLAVMYEHPTNFIGMGEVIDDLEKLAKSLPD